MKNFGTLSIEERDLLIYSLNNIQIRIRLKIKRKKSESAKILCAKFRYACKHFQAA